MDHGAPKLKLRRTPSSLQRIREVMLLYRGLLYSTPSIRHDRSLSSRSNCAKTPLHPPIVGNMNATEKSGDDCVNSPRWRVECGSYYNLGIHPDKSLSYLDNRLLRSQDHDNGSVASDSVHLVIDPSRSRPFQSYRTSKIRETQTSTPDTGQTSSSYNGSVSGARQRRLVRDFYAPAMELSLSAFATDIQSTFLIVSIGQKAVTALWEDISHPDDPSKRALETALFARFHPHTVSCEASSKWYGRALTKLSRDLQNPQSIWSTSVLRSAIILTMYEVCLSFVAELHSAYPIGLGSISAC